MNKLPGLLVVHIVMSLGCCAARAGDAVQDMVQQLGNGPALVVAVCGDDADDRSVLAQFVEHTSWKILCRVTSPSSAASLRDWARNERVLGTRLQVFGDPTGSLLLATDMADAVWIAPGVQEPPAREEILRVLHPGAACWGAGTPLVKPVDPRSDQWRHPYHGPDNNVVSSDGTARLPGELRFQTFPVFAAMPNQSLFAGGRIFFFTGHIAFHEREEPLLNTLTVLNAYNGLRLWSRPLDPSCVVHNFTKLATDREVVFAEGETLWVLDAASGAERGKFPVPADAAAAGDTDWKWIVQDGDTLWAALGPPDGRVMPHRLKRQMGHWPWDVADAQYRMIVDNFGAARRLAAFQFPEMQLRWCIQEPEPFDVRALCLEGGRIVQLAPRQYLAARDAMTGTQLWRRTPESAPQLFDAIGQALKRQGWGLGWATYCCARASRGVLCIAGPPFKQTIGVDLEGGELLWALDNESPHPFFLDDTLYVMPRVAAPASVCRKVHPRTGQVLDELSLGVIGSCTRLTVTPQQFFYRPGGGDGRTVYFDLAAQQLADYQGVVRPGCFDGVVPANGRLYWMPLACDCWQVHGTFCMAPRTPLPEVSPPARTSTWKTPVSSRPAGADDWPAFRADAAGSATVAVPVPQQIRESWRTRHSGGVTAPVCVGDRVLFGGRDGTVTSLDARTGDVVWRASAQAGVPFPPVYWNGRVLVASCDGTLYCLDAQDGRELGRKAIAPDTRLVNIMDQIMSVWPLGGGVVVDNQGVAYTAAGSTAADGTVIAAVDINSGAQRWQQRYTLDRPEPRLSFGVQANLLLQDDRLYINGGSPVGIVAVDARTGGDPRVVALLEAGMEMFLAPDGQPLCIGPEMYSQEWARTTIFKSHQGRVYFRLPDRWVALVDGRLFCARDTAALDRVVALMNTDPVTGGKLAASPAPHDVMRIPLDPELLWAGSTADVCGLAVGTNGLVVLHKDSVEALSSDGHAWWTVTLPATPVRWGVALTGRECIVTLDDGHVLRLEHEAAPSSNSH
jgi:outer membrane protein assembly factor BamB